MMEPNGLELNDLKGGIDDEKMLLIMVFMMER